MVMGAGAGSPPASRGPAAASPDTAGRMGSAAAPSQGTGQGVGLAASGQSGGASSSRHTGQAAPGSSLSTADDQVIARSGPFYVRNETARLDAQAAQHRETSRNAEAVRKSLSET